MKFRLLLVTLASAAATLRAQPPFLITGPDAGGSSVAVNTYAPNGSSTGSFAGGSQGFSGGLRIGAGDVDGDGIADIITGEGAGGSLLRVYTGLNHTFAASVNPFGGSTTLGVYVAAGDVNGDGRADLVAGQGGGAGSSPNVRVLSGADLSGATSLRLFSAFEAGYTGGVRVACGDVNGDGIADIIAGKGAGAGEVRVFSGKDSSMLYDFFAFDFSNTTGVNLGAGDVNHDGFADIIAGGPGQLKVFSGKTGAMLNSLLPFGASFTGEVRVAGADLNGDGFFDVVAGQGSGGTSLVTSFDLKSGAQFSSFAAYGGSSNGLFVSAVPEPGTWVLLLGGLTAMAAVQRRYAS